MSTFLPPIDGQRWLLLIHQLPPKPDYFRVKIGRRLARVGAVAIKNSVYVLPATDQGLEDFQWVLREIADGGGDASVCRSTFVDGLTDDEIVQFFRSARDRDYEQITAEVRATLKALPKVPALTPDHRVAAEDAMAKFRKRFATVARIDFFGASHQVIAREAIEQIEARLRPPRVEAPAHARQLDRADVHGRTWVTREGIFVDRIASAWLIRRFIDPDARFKFVTPQGYKPNAGELRFDMVAAEYTHEGDHCTFETLLRRFGLDDAALGEIAEIVHAVDLRDGKFDREDAAGIERILAGIAAGSPDDAIRLERGGALFDDLYALITKERAQASALGREPVTCR